MPGLSDDIGAVFEEKVLRWLPDLTKLDTNSTGWVPDFTGNAPNGDPFNLEAKTGYYDYGVRIKQEQVNGFYRKRIPTAYLIGFHTFENAQERLLALPSPERRKQLREHMNLHSTYVLTDAVVRAIWRREHTISKKYGVIYGFIKRRHPQQIIDDSPIERGGVAHPSARAFYGLNKKSLLVKKAGAGKKCGYILDATTDDPIIEYLRANCLI